MAKNKNRNELNYKKIKKTGWLGSLITFIIILALFTVMMIVVSRLLISFIITSKLNEEYKTIEYMGRLYDNYADDENVDVYKLLDEKGDDYYVKDNSGNIIHKTGKDTSITEKKGHLTLQNSDVVVYQDSEEGLLFPDEGDNYVDVSGISIIAKLIDDGKAEVILYEKEDIEKSDEDIDLNVMINSHEDTEDILNLPIWMEKGVNDGKETLVVKAYYSANVFDIVVFVIVYAVVVIVLAVFLIVTFIKIIRNIIRQRRILKVFFRDDITGGYNLTWFMLKGEALLRKRKNMKNNYAVINLSLLKYRNYIVCHSLDEGESLLAKINKTITDNIDKKDMCAHATPSSFAIIMKYDDEGELKNRLSELLKKLETVVPDHKFSYHVGVNYIKAIENTKENKARRKELSLETAYNSACVARASLEYTDETGIAVFNEKLIEEQRWLDNIQEKQQKAIDQEEFVVYYQPKYDPRTNELKGAEALIRWDSPDFGFVSPGRFIPQFEKNGFITEIDHYMISHVAKDQKRWLDQGLKCVPVSVNVSRAHFIEDDLAEQIRDMVDAAGTPHDLIEIELTESAFFDDKKAMIETINRLKSYGFKVSMDDFGSGYSSLNSLKDMPLDVLKLDAEFFRGDLADERGEIVVSEAIKLAKSLNMKTVAEGVEIKEQVEFLAAEGCDMIQGYYFAKPMPKDEYETKMS